MVEAGWLAAQYSEAAAAPPHLPPPLPLPPHRACRGPAGLLALPERAGALCKLSAAPERGGDLQAGSAASQKPVLQRPKCKDFVMAASEGA